MAHRTHVFLYTYECGPIHFVTMSKVLTSLKQYRKGYTAKPWLLATCPWKRLHKINIWFSFCPLSVPCSSLFKLLLEEKRGGGERRNKLITHKAPEALVLVLTVLQVLGGKATLQSGILQRGRG